jgi:hypothetical protein
MEPPELGQGSFSISSGMESMVFPKTALFGSELFIACVRFV